MKMSMDELKEHIIDALSHTSIFSEQEALEIMNVVSIGVGDDNTSLMLASMWFEIGYRAGLKDASK